MSNPEDTTQETNSEEVPKASQEASEGSVTPSNRRTPPPVPKLSSLAPSKDSEQQKATVPLTRKEARKKALKASTRKKNDPEYWGGTVILSSVVAFLLLQVVIAIGVVSYIIFADPSVISTIQSSPQDVELVFGDLPWLIIVSQLSMYLVWLGFLWWVAKYRSGVQKGRKFWDALRDTFWLRHFKVRDIFIGLGIAAAMMGFQIVVLNGLPAVFPDLDMTGAGNTEIFESLSGVWYYIIAFGIGGLLGPICEELFFRGFLLRGLINHFGFSKASRNIDDLEEGLNNQDAGLASMITLYRAWANKHRYALAIIISSIAFGFMHFQGVETFGQWLVIIVTGLLGLVLAITTVKLGRIAPAIIAHVSYNTASFIILTTTLGS